MRKFKNVTKKMAASVLCGITILSIGACGAKASNDMAYDSWHVETESSNGAWNTGVSYDSVKEEYYDYKSDAGAMEDMPLVESPASSAAGESGGTGEILNTTARKVIKTANLNLQTLDFDAFQTALEQKLAETSAYMQYADVSGTDYYGGRKSANYTIRVPEANLNRFLEGMEGIANVVNKTLGEEDVTLNYVDTEAHIKTLEIEQERLLALLEKADDLEYIIKLEQRLSEVRYSIESYKSRLRTYDDKITYSTVRIYVYEVTRVTEKEPETLWERISSGWAETLEDISTSAQDFLVWFVVSLPYLVFWGVVLVVLVVIIKKKRAERKAKKLEKQSGTNETILDSKE